MNKPRRIEIYDTTLRDGTQGEGFSLSLEDKLAIAQKLDELGVDYLEGGFPLSNPKDEAFFREIRTTKLKNAKVAAFGMTRRRGIKAEEDPGMRALLDAQTPVVTLVGKSSEYQAKAVLAVSLEENLAMIAESVKLMCQAGRQVIYDAEHFFDGYASNPDYALQTLLSAQKAGASCLCLCDTNGGSLPEHIAAVIDAIKPHITVKIGIHTHNDSGLAVANTLVAVQHGAVQAQGTINGIGERCGNVDLTTVAANLALKLKKDILTPGGLKRSVGASTTVVVSSTGDLEKLADVLVRDVDGAPRRSSG
jgi:2-isopropylmalate synthase